MSNPDAPGQGRSHAHQVQNLSGGDGGGSVPRSAGGRATEFNFLGTLAQNLLRASILAAVPTFAILIIGAAMVLSAGVKPVNDAANRMYTAEANWFATLQQAQPVIMELGARGAPMSEIETVYFAFLDAEDEAKGHQADILLQVLFDQTEAVRIVHGDAGQAYELIQPSVRARNSATLAYHGWFQSMEHFPSRLAVAFGMARGPDPKMARYGTPMAPDAQPSRSGAPPE